MKISILIHSKCCCNILFQTPTHVQTLWQGVERHSTVTFRWIKMLISINSCCCSLQSIVLLVWSGRNTSGRKLWQVFSEWLSLFCSLYTFRDFSVSCNCFFSLVPWPNSQRWLHCINSMRHTAKRKHSHFKDVKNVPNDSPQSKVCCTARSFHWCKLQWVCINWGEKLRHGEQNQTQSSVCRHLGWPICRTTEHKQTMRQADCKILYINKKAFKSTWFLHNLHTT